MRSYLWLSLTAVLSIPLSVDATTAAGPPPAGATPVAPPVTPAAPAPAKNAAPEEDPAEAGKAGIKLFHRNGPTFVEEVTPGSGAEAAGLLPGDQILAIDGEPLEGESVHDISKRIRGPVGTRVNLTIKRPGQPPRELPVVRGTLPAPDKKAKVATSALPRLKAFASRDEHTSLLQAVSDVEKKGDPAEMREAWPIAVACLARADHPDARAKAGEMLPEALELDPANLELPTAAERLFLSDPARPDEARRLADAALAKLRAQKEADRSRDRAIAAWTALLGGAELAAGAESKGVKLLESSLQLQTGDRMAAVTADGKVRWSSTLGPKDRWQKVAAVRIKGGRPLEAATLALEALRWGESEEARALLETAVQAGGKADLTAFTGESWPVTPAPAPPLILTDVKGRQHSLEALKGKVVMVNLWATWCGPCNQEMEALKKTYERLKDRGFEILAVSVDQDTSLVAPWVEKKALPFPAGLAPKRAPLYRTSNVPITFLVDRQGRLVYSHVGYSTKTYPEVEAKLEALLAEQESAPLPVVENAWRQDRLVLKGHASLARVQDVVVADGPQGPQVWALLANGSLEVLRLRPPRTPDEVVGLELESLLTLGGFGGVDSLAAVDLEGDRISERALINNDKGTVAIEASESGLTRIFLVAPAAVGEVVGADLDGDRRQEVLVGYLGEGLRAVGPEGDPRFWLEQGDRRSVTPVDLDGDGRLEVVVPLDDRRLQVLSAAGAPVRSIEVGGPAGRVFAARLEPKGRPALIVRDRSYSQAVAADLDGDGRDEVAVVAPHDTLLVFDPNGELSSRVTFKADRLKLAAGDLDSDGIAELVVGGEGLGVAVIGGSRSAR